MTRTLVACAALTLAAACAPMEGDMGGPPPMQDGPDQCRASAYQSYVGRNRSELPRQPDGEMWRVTCTTCPVTMDYNPRRLNVVFNERTNIIEAVRCG